MSAQPSFDFAPIGTKRRGSYYVTTRMTLADGFQAVQSAAKQDEAILALYRSRGALSPSDVLALCESAGKRWPLTSIRRAITTLTTDGLLIQLEAQKRGPYNKPEHLWILAGKSQA